MSSCSSTSPNTAASHASKWYRVTLLILAISTGALAGNRDAKAIPAVDRDAIIAAAFASSILFPTPPTVAAEAAAAAAAWAAYYAEQPTVTSIIGQAELNRAFPVTFAALGETATLSFSFLNPSTLLPVTGPTIGSVIYEQSQTPDNPASFTLIGTSTNPSSDFGLAYTAGSTLTTVEQEILAIPENPSGLPIVLPGVGGFNAAEGGLTILPAIPEPRGLLILLSGLLAMLLARICHKETRTG